MPLIRPALHHSQIERPGTRCSIFFFFNDTATTEIYTLSLHDALPISGAEPAHRRRARRDDRQDPPGRAGARRARPRRHLDRKSTRLNSSHSQISYAVFCLKKKKTTADAPNPGAP